jgi:hypothetical protein
VEDLRQIAEQSHQQDSSNRRVDWNSLEERRRYGREYYHTHRAKIRARDREQYRAAIPKEDPEVLAAALRDPSYEERHGIRRRVICRVCGAIKKKLARHLKQFHKLTAEQYRTQFPGCPLTSSAIRRKTSADQKRLKSELRHRAYPGMSSVRGHRGEKPLRHWLVLCLIVQGKNAVEAGKILNRDNDTVLYIASELNLQCASSRLYDFGKPMTYAYGLRLQMALGLDRETFASLFGMPRLLAYRISVRHLANSRIAHAHARSIIEVRDWFIRRIRELAGKHRRGGPNSTRVDSTRFLMAALPDLPRTYVSLRQILVRSRQFLRNAPEAGIDEWHDWLCAQARLETGGRLPGNLFTKFLPFAPEISQFVEEKLAALRAPGGSVRQLAAEILASRLKVSSSLIRHCNEKRPLPPSDAEHLILTTSRGSQAAPSGRADGEERKKSAGKRKRAKVPFQKTVWFALGQKIERLIAEGYSVIDARKEVQRGYEYGTVVRYHRRYRRAMGLPAPPPPRTI